VEGLRVRAAQRRLSSRKTSQLLYEKHRSCFTKNIAAALRKTSQLLYEKHRILRFFLGGLRPLVLRSASCRAAFMLRDQCAEFTKNIASCDFFLAGSARWCCARHPAEQRSCCVTSALSSRKTWHPAIFSWRAPPAGAALGILPSSVHAA
jgi:hypothetical protein